MTQSQSFDRAADFYDRTRDLPQAIALHGIPAILEAAGPNALILDVGTGTGRISVPLLQRGGNVIGLDLSMKMMALLRGKFPSANLTQADASQIPFPRARFDAVLTCHVMHLIGLWREALREFRRVLKPGGVYINAGTDGAPDSSRKRMREHWQAWITEHRGTWRRPGAQDDDELLAEVRSIGGTVTRVEVVRYPSSDTVGQFIEELRDRIHSSTWQIHDEMLAASVLDLHTWARGEFGPGYMDRAFNEESTFVLDVTRFGDSVL